MKNVTITADEKVLRWARREAAERGVSVSKLVGQILDREMRRTDSYWRAFEEWKKIKPVRMTASLPMDRESAHERRK